MFTGVNHVILDCLLLIVSFTWIFLLKMPQRLEQNILCNSFFLCDYFLNILLFGSVAAMVKNDMKK